MTAAHVVAGESDTEVRIPGDVLPFRPATIVLLDAHNDVAVLRVSGVDLEPLRLADPRSGAAVAILGYPLDGGLTATPGRMGRTATVLTQDALGRGPVARTITAVPGGSCTATPAGRRSTRRGGRVDDLRPASRLGERLRRPAFDHPQRSRARRHAGVPVGTCAP